MAIQRNPSTINESSVKPRGTYHLSDNPNLYEIQRTNNFEFVITGDGFMQGTTLKRAGTDAKPFNGDYAQEVIRMSVATCPIPHFTQNVIEVRRGNSVLKYAGTPTFSEGQIVINDYIGADTKSILMAWQNKSYNVQTEKVGLMEDYKRTCYLIEYTPDYQEVRRWILRGCWISGLSEDNYTNDDNSRHQITATIQYDRAEIDVSELV